MNSETASPFYPPRARWYNRFLSPWFALRRVLHLDRIHLPDGISFTRFLLSLVIPGFSFFARGQRIFGWAFLGAYGVAVIIFFGALGYGIANVAFGLMISIHASSIVYMEFSWVRERSVLGYRIFVALGTALIVWLAAYAPLVNYLGTHWLMPLRTPRGVVVVNLRAAPRHVARGDWIAYRVGQFQSGEVIVRAGFAVEKVLGLTGDHIQFSVNSMRINNAIFPRPANTPADGEWIVPEKCWFILPNLAQSGHGRAAQIHLMQAMQANGMVSESDWIGKPFARWFGRKQLP
ncbi:MAG TPA: hypothetical protein VFM25_10475 [Verrucomicrobiae bacterium]|nr:hypothetical protein [Verrucomicrobiae bacterium]